MDPHTTRTVGLAFQTDIMFLMRLPEFWKHLDDPIIQFVTDLNGLEEDPQYQELFQHGEDNQGASTAPDD